jgi:8-oxo-dGTP diphosphatase
MLLQTTLCYLEQDGCYLMLHRVKKQNDVNHDKWIGVGGKFEPGETAEACALREVQEETGCCMLSPAYRGVVDFFCPPWPAERMHLYTCPAFTGRPEDFPCDEGKLAWVRKESVFSLPIWEGDRIFLRLLAEDAPFFRLALTYGPGDRLTHAVLDGRELPLAPERDASLL